MTEWTEDVRLKIPSENGIGIILTLDTSSLAKFPEKVSVEFASLWYQPVEDLQNVPRMLKGDRCHILRGEKYAIFASGADDPRSVELDIRTPSDEHWVEMHPTENLETTFQQFPVPVSRRSLAEELIREIEAYIETLNEDRPVGKYRRRLHVAQQALNYYEEHGMMDGFERSYSRETVEEVLFGDDNDEDVERYAVDNGVVRDITAEIFQHEDPEQVADRLNDLLTGHHAIRRPITEQILDTVPDDPDEQVVTEIFYPVYLQDPVETPLAIETLVRLDADEGLSVIRDYIEESEYPEIRRAAAEGLAALGDQKAIEPLERAVENDPDESVRETARDALERLRE